MRELETLRRSPRDAKIAGVCGGVAERVGIDPLLVRIAAVIVALCSGIGVVLYASAWLALPRGEQPPPIRRLIPSTVRWSARTWSILVGATALLVVVTVGRRVTIGYVPGIVVAALWFAGAIPSGNAQQSAADPRTAPHPGTEMPPSAPVVITTRSGPWTPRTPWGDPVTYAEALRFFSLPDPAGLYAAPGRSATASQQNRAASASPQARARWGLVALLGVLLLGLAAVTDLGVHVPTSAYLAAALVVAGLSLLAGARSPRPKGLLAMTLVLGLLTVATTSPQNRMASPTSTYTQVEDSDDLPRAINVEMGSTTLDLSHASLSEPATVDVSVWMGDLTIILPQDPDVRVVWSLTSGLVTGPDGEESLSGTGAYGPEAATVVLDVTVVNGQLTVRYP